MTITTIDTTPSTRMMSVVGAFSSKPHRAVADLVDNALDAAVNGTATVGVGLDPDASGGVAQLWVVDNGKGMTLEELKLAMSLGQACGKDETHIGQYGTGMKGAIASLGTMAKIITRARHEDVLHSVPYDVGAGSWEIPVETRPAGGFDPGTYVWIQQPKEFEYATLVGRLRRHLPKLYAWLIRSEKLHLEIAGQTVTVPPSPELVADPALRCDFDFEIEGKRVHGYVAAAATSQPYSGIGFDCLYRGRLIDTLPLVFEKSPRYDRVVGVIYLDGFAVTLNKDAFIENKAFEAMTAKLAEVVGPTLELIAPARANVGATGARPRIDKALCETLTTLVTNLATRVGFPFAGLGTKDKDAESETTSTPAVTVPGPRPRERQPRERAPGESRQREPRKPRSYAGVKFVVEQDNTNPQAPTKKVTGSFDDGFVIVVNIAHPTYPKEVTARGPWATDRALEGLALAMAMTEDETPGYAAYAEAHDAITRTLVGGS